MCSNRNDNEEGLGFTDLSPTSSSSSKTQKRHRIPKRGPGVAELEKILREQQALDDPQRRRFSPPRHLTHTTPKNHNHNHNNNNVLPFIWTSHNEEKLDDRERVVPKQYFHNPTLLMNHFSPSISSSVGLNHPIEPPSSQRCQFGGVKRPLSVENHYQIPRIPSQKQRVTEKHNANVYKSMPSAGLDFSYFPSCNMELNGIPERNFIKFVSQNAETAPSSPFQVFPQHFGIVDHNQDLKQQSTESELNKPFYSFLQTNDPTATKGSSCVVDNTGEDGIDLNLKLSST